MDKPWTPPKFVDVYFRPDTIPSSSIAALRSKIALLGDLPGPTGRISAVICAVCWGLFTISILLGICLGRHPAGGLLPIFFLAIIRVFTYVLRAIMCWTDHWHASMLTAEAMCLNGGLALLCLGLTHLFSQAAKPYRPERWGLLRFFFGPMYWIFWLAICASTVLFVIAGHALFKMLMGDLEWTTKYKQFVRIGLQILVVIVGIHIELVATLWFLRGQGAYDQGATTARVERTKLIFLSLITLLCAWLVTYATITAYVGGRPHWFTSASGFFAVSEPIELLVVLIWVSVRWQSLLFPPPPVDEASLTPDIVDCPTPQFIVYTQQPARPSSSSSVDWQKAGRVFSPAVKTHAAAAAAHQHHQVIVATSPLAHQGWIAEADEPPRSARRRAGAAQSAAARDSHSEASLRSKWSPDSPIHSERHNQPTTPVSAGFVAKKLLLLGQGGGGGHAHGHHHGYGGGPPAGPSGPASKRLL